MTKKSEDDPQAPNRLLSSWDQIAKCLGNFPAPKTAIEYDIDVDVKVTGWVFRGLKNRSYKLQPTIEREVRGKDLEWPSLEEFISSEFKARARMHLSPSLIPDEKLTFTWLALMQHYAIPTRLLDFTYSPFVALYFAIRNGHEHAAHPNGRTHVRLWAVDAVAVNDRFRQVAWVPARVKKRNEGELRSAAIDLNPDSYASQRERITESLGLHELIAESLSATGKHRSALGRSGCVCAASPPAFNPRLVSQQGAFLLNCAEDLSFQDSLKKMMEPCTSEWCMTFDIPVRLIPKIESQLFQMNIHEQALFPDIEGLAGLIRQKTRLHW